jgi:hypothetical protein
LILFRARSAAFLANPVDLKSVAGGEIAVLVPDFLLQAIDLLGKELHGTAAFRADHVMMTAAIVLMFEAGDAVVKGDFAGQSAPRQQLERAVDGGVANANVLLLNQAMKFIGREMVAGFKKSSKNGVALGRLLQTDTLQMAMQNVLRFADHLAREGGLIIDAFLQHGQKGRLETGTGQVASATNPSSAPADQNSIRHLENEIHFRQDGHTSASLE